MGLGTGKPSNFRQHFETEGGVQGSEGEENLKKKRKRPEARVGTLNFVFSENLPFEIGQKKRIMDVCLSKYSSN